MKVFLDNDVHVPQEEMYNMVNRKQNRNYVNILENKGTCQFLVKWGLSLPLLLLNRKQGLLQNTSKVLSSSKISISKPLQFPL